MIRKLQSGQFRLYSRKKHASTGKRRSLQTFATLEKAKQHEREVRYFNKHAPRLLKRSAGAMLYHALVRDEHISIYRDDGLERHGAGADPV